MKNAIKLIEVSNNFFCENTEKGLSPWAYLSKILESHQMFQNVDFWEWAIFEGIKEELRSEFFQSIQDDNTVKELIYSKLL